MVCGLAGKGGPAGEGGSLALSGGVLQVKALIAIGLEVPVEFLQVL